MSQNHILLGTNLKNNQIATVELPLSVANRHGLIAGATGTGKTITLQSMAGQFSKAGVPVFLADVKGDLSGLAKAGSLSTKMKERLSSTGQSEPQFQAAPVVFWDVFGKLGHPLRATVSDLGPLMFSRLLKLNDTQEGVLNIVFKIADDKELHLFDLKDLKSLLNYVAENAKTFQADYGQISPASVATIQRALLQIENQGAEDFFGEPMLNIQDFLQTNEKGEGYINLLASEKLMHSPQLYSIFLLWLLSELFENLPEAGDLEKPKIVFFFDEAHLLFNEAPKILTEKIEQVVRLIRSKGVGVFFVTQNPLDLPETVLAQLGHRVQHALRAFTPKDQKAVKTAAQTMRANPEFKTEDVITQLGVGEALVSVLDSKGVPTITEKVFMLAPTSQIGPVSEPERKQMISQSYIYGVYEKEIDQESAYEKLQKMKTNAQFEVVKSEDPLSDFKSSASKVKPRAVASSTAGRQRQTVVEAMAKTAARTVANEVGKQLIRGILGGLFGGRR